MPPAAAWPAKPINKLLPTLLDIREAPICQNIKIIQIRKKERTLQLFLCFIVKMFVQKNYIKTNTRQNLWNIEKNITLKY